MNVGITKRYICVGKFTASLFSYRMEILDSDGMESG